MKRVIFGAFLVWFLSMSFMNRNKKEVFTEASILMESYVKDEKKANAMYQNHNITIKGNIEKFSYLNNKITVFLKTTYDSSSILCEMKDTEEKKVSELCINDLVRLTGVCKGFLKDVIILDCELTNLSQ